MEHDPTLWEVLGRVIGAPLIIAMWIVGSDVKRWWKCGPWRWRA